MHNKDTVLLVHDQVTNLIPMVGNLLKVAADNLLKVVEDNNLLKVAEGNNLLKVVNLTAVSLKVDSLKADSNLLVDHNLITLLRKIQEVLRSSSVLR